MQLLEVLILAVVQALTEFLPVSSSGHLLAIDKLSSIDSSLTLDVLLHFGTLLALVIYFRRTLWQLATGLHKPKQQNLLRNLVISTIPAVIAGGLFENMIETSLRSVYVVIVMLIVVGLLLIVADREFGRTSEQKPHEMSKNTALCIGAWQALALIPGTSRSGITMLAGRARGLSNHAAAEYSFLIGVPVILGATLRMLLEPETRAVLVDDTATVALGVAAAALVGLGVIHFLLNFLKRHGLAIFGYYRIALAFVLLMVAIQ